MGPGFEPLRTYKPKAVYLYKVNGFIINIYCDNHYIRHDGLRSYANFRRVQKKPVGLRLAKTWKTALEAYDLKASSITCATICGVLLFSLK